MEWPSAGWVGGARELFTFIVMAEINIPQLQAAVEDNTCLRQLYSSRNHDPSTLFLPRLVLNPTIMRICVRNWTFEDLDNILSKSRESLNLGFLDSWIVKRKTNVWNQKEIKRVAVAERCLKEGGNGSSSSSAHLHTIIDHLHTI